MNSRWHRHRHRRHVNLRLLSEHQDVQDKLHEEILDAQERCGEAIPYREPCPSLPWMPSIKKQVLRILFVCGIVIAQEDVRRYAAVNMAA